MLYFLLLQLLGVESVLFVFTIHTFVLNELLLFSSCLLGEWVLDTWFTLLNRTLIGSDLAIPMYSVNTSVCVYCTHFPHFDRTSSHS